MPFTRAMLHAERTLTRLLSDGHLHLPEDVRRACAQRGVPDDELEAAIRHLQIGRHVLRGEADGTFVEQWWMPNPRAPKPYRAPTGRTP